MFSVKLNSLYFNFIFLGYSLEIIIANDLASFGKYPDTYLYSFKLFHRSDINVNKSSGNKHFFMLHPIAYFVFMTLQMV